MNDTTSTNYQPEKNDSMITLTAFARLVETLPEVPGLVDPPRLDAAFFSSPQINAIGGYIVELIRQQLNCRQVLLASVDVSQNRCYLMAASGLTEEQIQQRQKLAATNKLSTFTDPSALNMLQTNEVVLLSRALLPIPAEISEDFGQQIMLLVPLMTHKQLVGVLIIGRDGTENAYTREEIALVKAIAKLVVLIIGRIELLGELADSYTRTRSIQETNQRMNEFINMASHELKTPLTTVMGNLQVAQRRLQRWKNQVEPENENTLSQITRVEHPLQDALTRARFQQSVINNMLDASSIQTNSLILHTEVCNLTEIVKEAIKEAQKKLPTLPIVLQGDTEHENIPVYADTRRIGQVITNYLTNALEYSADDQPVNVLITVEGNTARLAVQDTGASIPPEEQERIWERFYRVKGIAVQHELDLSLGLGLYICDNIIRLHHGHVGVESSLGQGSTFWFTLPIADAETDKSPNGTCVGK